MSLISLLLNLFMAGVIKFKKNFLSVLFVEIIFSDLALISKPEILAVQNLVQRNFIMLLILIGVTSILIIPNMKNIKFKSPERLYQACIANNPYSKAFDYAYGYSRKSAIDRLKKQNPELWRISFIWLVSPAGQIIISQDPSFTSDCEPQSSLDLF